MGPTASRVSPSLGAGHRGSRSVTLRVLLAASILAAVVTTGVPGRADALRRTPSKVARSRSVKIAPGVWWTRMVLDTPERVNILRITPGSDATLDTVLAAGNVLPGYQQTSTMVTNDGGIAGINGDFGLPPGRPAHMYWTNGTLVQTTLMGQLGFAESQSKNAIDLGHPWFSAVVTDKTAGSTFDVSNWNAPSLKPKQIGAYTTYGGSVGAPPSKACYAQLLPSGSPFWTHGKTGIGQLYSAGSVACQDDPPNFNGGVILAAIAKTRNARLLGGITEGDSLRTTISAGWPDVLDMVGGVPLLVYGGHVTVPRSCTAYLCRRNPRTAIGVTAAGAILLVTIDGRWQKMSVGMTLYGEAKFMKRLGCISAMNLDGGGSTTMVVNGLVVNHPSAGSQRYVTNAVVVLPGLDPNDPVLPVGPSSAVASLIPESVLLPGTAVPASVAAQASMQALLDPGSTGGLLRLAMRRNASNRG